MSAGTTVRPDHRLAAEHGVVGDLHRLALDHDVQAAVPPVAAGGQHDVRVTAQVGELLLPGTGRKPDGSLGPGATTGVTCGRPSARTVEIQNSSASSSALRVSSQPVAVAAKNARWGSTSREVASSFAAVVADNRPGGGQDSMV